MADEACASVTGRARLLQYDDTPLETSSDCLLFGLGAPPRMELREYIGVVHRFWRSAVATILVCILAAAAATLLTPKVYQSSTGLFASIRGSTFDVAQLAQGSSFSQARVKSYARFLTNETVLQQVIDDLKLNLTVPELRAMVSVGVPADTVLVEVTVRDRDPKRAQLLAGSLGSHFSAYVNQLESADAGQVSPVRLAVVQQAEFPTVPTSPRPVSNLLTGLLVGLAIGLGQAFLRSSLDSAFRRAEDLELALDVPVLGTIPQDPELGHGGSVLVDEPHSLTAEAFRVLRTNLGFLDVDARPRSLLMTSALTAEGKSVTTTRLAMALAQTNTRVLIVEADLRRPSLLGYFGMRSNGKGLTEVLAGRCSLEQAVRRHDATGVYLLPSGSTPPNPSELLSSETMGSVLRTLESRYDLVLIDAPPLLPVADAAAVASRASGVVLIVRAGSTKLEDLERCIVLLGSVGAKVFGSILNRAAPLRAARYGYYTSPQVEVKSAEPF